MRNLLIAGMLLAAVGPQAALASRGHAVKAPAEESVSKGASKDAAETKGVSDEKATDWKLSIVKKQAVVDQSEMEAKKVSSNRYPTYRAGGRTFTKVKTATGSKSAG